LADFLVLWVGSVLFFLFAGELVLEVFGEYFHVSFFRNVVDDCGWDFEIKQAGGIIKLVFTGFGERIGYNS
jgi:hypothetical protein